jgi:hypothetical protein
MNELTSGLITIGVAIIGVATLAVIVSRNSNTTGVITATASGFSQSLATALSPITGTAGSSSGIAGGSYSFGSGGYLPGSSSFPIA